MSLVSRGVRGVFKSPVRSVAVLLLLTLSVTAVLVMILVRGSVDQRLALLRDTVGTDIQVRPVGSFQGAGEPLIDSEVQELEALDHVVAVDRVLQAQYNGDALESAIDFSSFEGRGGGGTGGVFGDGAGGTPRVIPISFNGVSSLERPQLLGGRFGAAQGEFTLAGGRVFTGDEGADHVVVIGETLAEKNELAVGSLLNLEDTAPLEVIGIFSSGNQFGDNSLYMPLGTLRQIIGADDGISLVTLYVDSVDNLQLVTAAITGALREGRVDVSSDLDIVERQSASLSDIRDSSSAGTVAALAGAGGVILLATFLVVRERTREIGVLKAIGASWSQLLAQFTVESLTISVVAGVTGFVLALATSQTVAAQFFDPTPQTLDFGGFSRFRPGGGEQEGFGGLFGGQFGGGSLGPLDISVSPDLLLYALGVVMTLSLLGGLVEAVYIARLNPAEVLRRE